MRDDRARRGHEFDSVAACARAGYDVTLSSVRGGTIPFDPASMDPADSDHKIVHRFFEDGAPSHGTFTCMLAWSDILLASRKTLCSQEADAMPFCTTGRPPSANVQTERHSGCRRRTYRCS